MIVDTTWITTEGFAADGEPFLYATGPAVSNDRVYVKIILWF